MAIPTQATFNIVTQSQFTKYKQWPAPTAPVITINNVPVAIPEPLAWPTGIQLLILDSTRDYTNPANILCNKYFYVYSKDNSSSWMSTYQRTYNDLCRGLLTNGNLERQLVVLATFGLDYNMGPITEVLNLLLNYGGGSLLQKWSSNVDIGSQDSAPNSWVSYPGNYIMLGNSSFRCGEGHEVLDAVRANTTVKSTLSVTLYNPPV